MRYFVYLILFIMCSSVYGQKICGTVRDLETDEPLPFVHIKLQHYYFGTVSNSDGQFSINLPGVEHQVLEFSAIGYEKAALKVADLYTSENLIIRLKRNDLKLSEVIITPKNHAFNLMRAAIEHIPQNYPSEPEVLKAFLRNSAFTDDGTPFYLIELTELMGKQSYKRPSDDGSVEMLESQKVEFQSMDSLKERFYNGVHLGFWGDLVASREAVLDIGKVDKYELDIVDTTVLNNEALYEVEFSPKERSNVTGRGSIFIMDSSYAIPRIFISYNAQEVTNSELIISKLRSLRRTSRSFDVTYQEHDGIWRLKDIKYESTFDKNLKPYLSLTDELLVTAIDSAGYIPYEKTLDSKAIVLDQVSDYDADYWKDENILLSSENVRVAYEGNEVRSETHKSTREKILEHLARLDFSFGLSFQNISAWETGLTYVTQSYSQTRWRGLIYAPAFTYGYKLNNRWVVGIEAAGSEGKYALSFFGSYAKYNMNLKKYGKPIILSPKISVGQMNILESKGSISNADYSPRAQDKLDATRADISLMQRSLMVKPGVNLRFKLQRRSSLDLYASYSWGMFSKTGVYLFEQQSFFKRRGFFEANDQLGELFQPDWNFGVGFSF